MSLKRNPANDTPTAQRVLDTAERLFSEQGVDATSVRQITSEADVNVASVNYHFGSKDELAAAVFERVIARATRQRLDALAGIVAEADAKGEAPDLARLVSSFIEPYLGDGNQAQGVLMARFILMHRLSPDDSTRQIVEAHLNPMAQAYVAAISRACPSVSGPEVFWRYLLMVSATVLTSTEDLRADRLSILSGGATSVADRGAARDALVRFIVAGLQGGDEVGFQPVIDNAD